MARRTEYARQAARTHSRTHRAKRKCAGVPDVRTIDTAALDVLIDYARKHNRLAMTADVFTTSLARATARRLRIAPDNEAAMNAVRRRIERRNPATSQGTAERVN